MLFPNPSIFRIPFTISHRGALRLFYNGNICRKNKKVVQENSFLLLCVLREFFASFAVKIVFYRKGRQVLRKDRYGVFFV
jgi:hypothetical protein